MPELTPVARHSLSDSVFRQLRDRIVRGELVPGEPLPAERQLCQALGVNRSAVREAIKRLEQARLVAVRHGEASRVLDYRHSAGLDLLSSLLVTSDESFDPDVVRGVMEMRSALAPDIARRAALRGGEIVALQLRELVAEMSRAAGDLPRLQIHAAAFWSLLVVGADNVAYRLAYNSLTETYDRCRDLLTQVLAGELTALEAYHTIAEAVEAHDGDRAEATARALVRRGEVAVVTALGFRVPGGTEAAT